MTHYRFDVLNPDGSTSRGTHLDLSDDNVAFANALAQATDGAVEVWDGTRKVCFIDQTGQRRAGTG